MKTNNYPAMTENEADSVTDKPCDKQKNLLMDVLAKPLTSVSHNRDTNRKEIKNHEKVDGVVIGKVISCDNSGMVTVEFAGMLSDKPLIATTLITVSVSDINNDVALMFEAGNPQRPIIMGRLQCLAEPVEKNSIEAVNVQLDGKRLTFNAEEQIVLRCGEASITLTRAGKVIIRGEYLLSRSTGTNRIKGGSVQIN